MKGKRTYTMIAIGIAFLWSEQIGLSITEEQAHYILQNLGQVGGTGSFMLAAWFRYLATK